MPDDYKTTFYTSLTVVILEDSTMMTPVAILGMVLEYCSGADSFLSFVTPDDYKTTFLKVRLNTIQHLDYKGSLRADL